MRICVTGGTGFVGRAVVRTLAGRGHSVLVPGRDPGKAAGLPTGAAFVLADLGEPATLERALGDFGPEALVHLAWEGLPDYGEAICRRNVALGLDVFELARRAGVRHVVACGSCWEYAARRGCLTEDAPLGHESAFPAAKNRLHREGRERLADVPLTWLRLFYAYGEGQRPGSLIPSLLERARAGLTPEVRCPGNRNDFIHVDDAALALALVLETRPAGEVYNLGTGLPTAVAEIVRLVYAELGREDLLAPPAPGAGATEDFWADMGRLRADTGFVPRIDPAAGVASLLGPAASREGGTR